MASVNREIWKSERGYVATKVQISRWPGHAKFLKFQPKSEISSKVFCTKNDFLRRGTQNGLKEYDQSFLNQLNSEIKAIKSIGKA